MSIETELKLRIAPEHLNRFKRHPLLGKLSISRAATHKLHNIYYDTPGLALRERKMALRLRRIGKQWLQTLKGGGGVQAGLHRRNEWETPVAGDALDFEALKACGGAHLPSSLRKKLQPLFVTDFFRTTRLLAFGGAEIELCIDSGEIRAGQASRQISELELELKSGEAAQLFKLALALLDIAPLEIEHTSKAEFGYRLFSDAQLAVTRADTPDLSKCLDVPGALQAMIWSCLDHLQANVPGAIQKLDEEYLHQVRVALRRLRVALAMTGSFRADPELSLLNEQAAELCGELGRLREWDVFVTQVMVVVRAHLPEQAGLRTLMLASEELRGQHHAATEKRLQSQDYQRFLLCLGAWMHGDYWYGKNDGDIPPSRFILQTLDKRSRQVSKRGKHLAAADPGQLHALRIACKKLRYSLEMFASLLEPNKIKRYLSALATLQDTLGALNDIAVARRLLDELDTEALHESIILLRGWIEHDHMEKIIKLNKAWKSFSGQKAFWCHRAGNNA